MSSRPFITADAVAGMIGLADGAAFLRQRPRLERDHDFPAPMPTSLRPLIWRRSEIEGWVRAQGRPATMAPADGFHPPAHASGNVVLLDRARRA